MFWLKKFVAFWLMPLPVCLALLTAGWVLTLSPRRRVLGRWLAGIGLALLLLFSNKAVSAWLVRPFESRYPAVPEFAATAPVPAEIAACRYVVVLGGGHSDTTGLSAVNQLSTSAQGRVMEAVRVLRGLPQAQLIVSGPGQRGRETHAAVLQRAAVSLGVESDRVIRIDTARDTEDEAREIRARVGDQPFLLVTSAWHMPRAMALMRGAGVQPIACPCDYAARPKPGFQANDYTWDTESLTRSTRAVHEAVGLLWVRLRGKTG